MKILRYHTKIKYLIAGEKGVKIQVQWNNWTQYSNRTQKSNRRTQVGPFALQNQAIRPVGPIALLKI